MSITRAITLSIQPVADSISYDALWKALHQSWNAVQRAANATMRTYLAGDKARTVTGRNGKPVLDKIDKSVANAAYHHAREAAPELPSSPIADISQRVRGRYLHDRWAIQIAAAKSCPTFSRQLPLSIRRKDWQLLTGTDDKGRECYFARFPLLDMLRNDRPTVRFVCRTARDAKLLHKIAAGDYEKQTLEILPPGWIRKGAIRAKVVYSRSDVSAKESGGRRMMLRTAGADHLLVASVEGDDQVMHWNHDWLRSRIVAYERARHRRSEDLKHERRVPKSRRRVWREDAGRAAEKHHNRVKTTIQQIAAQVIGRAKRGGCDIIEFDDTDRSWIESFPWHMLRAELKRCGENNEVEVQFTKSNDDSSGRCSAQQSGGQPCADTADCKPRSVGSGRKGGAM